MNTAGSGLRLHDVGENPGRYLGLSFYGSSRVEIPQYKWPGWSGEDGEHPPELEGRRYSDYHSWGTVWTDVPEGAVEDGDLTIIFGLVVKKGTADTVWFDSVGMGNEIVPYQYMSGTSMATPVTAGAAAVLAAQTGKTGSALVDHVKATVRQTDALWDKVATGGILDFAVSGATPPDREPVPARPLYDTRLPLDMSTGEDPFDYDAPGDWETDGPLVGVGDKLYYLPLMTDHGDFGVLLSFDPATGTWKTLRPLPVPIYACSAAAFEGKLVVKGNTEIYYDAEETKTAVWVYDPETDSWSQANANGVLVRQTLFAGEDGRLLLAGFDKIGDLETEEPDPSVLASYDPETGAGEGRGLDYWYDFPRAVEKDGAIYLFCASDYSLVKVTEDEEEDLTYTLPDYRAMNLDPDEYYSYDERTERDGVLLATDEGLLLVGVLSEDGAADTWLLRDGAEQFEPLLRKTCLTRPFFVAAEVLNGRVYAIGTVWNEDAIRFFRANDLATLNEPIPAPKPRHSGGGGAPATNPVTVPTASAGATIHGSVKSSAANAKAGDTVTLTPEPEEGYDTAGVTVTDAKGNVVPVTQNADGTYSFTMPATAVTITPEFVPLPAPDPAPTGDVADRFRDVSKTAWYHDAVQWAVDKGLMNGVSEDTFAPNDTCTRAMIVTMLWRLAGEPASDSKAPFTDVSSGAWYADAVNWAASTGAVKGTSETTFSPNAPVTREQLAAILYRYAQAQGKGFTGAWYFLLDFPDAAEVSEWANEAMHWMTMHGVITGMDDGTLAPKDNATRAQIAAMFLRFCEALEE